VIDSKNRELFHATWSLQPAIRVVLREPRGEHCRGAVPSDFL
jgi:hypothetical protein